MRAAQHCDVGIPAQQQSRIASISVASAGSSRSSRASFNVSACARLLMSSDVHAKCTNSMCGASSASSPQLLFDEILDRLDVMVRGAFDVLDPLHRPPRRNRQSMASIALRAVALERRQFCNRAFGGQMLGTSATRCELDSAVRPSSLTSSASCVRRSRYRPSNGDMAVSGSSLHAQWISLGRANVVSMLRMVDRRNIRCQRRPPD